MAALAALAALDTNSPVMMPPPRVIPNFQGESRAGSVIVTCITVTALMVFLVILRDFPRMGYAKPYGYDGCKLLIEEFDTIH